MGKVGMKRAHAPRVKAGVDLWGSLREASSRSGPTDVWRTLRGAVCLDQTVGCPARCASKTGCVINGRFLESMSRRKSNGGRVKRVRRKSARSRGTISKRVIVDALRHSGGMKPVHCLAMHNSTQASLTNMFNLVLAPYTSRRTQTRSACRILRKAPDFTRAQSPEPRSCRCRQRPRECFRLMLLAPTMSPSGDSAGYSSTGSSTPYPGCGSISSRPCRRRTRRALETPRLDAQGRSRPPMCES
jgi:hypothetical protein